MITTPLHHRQMRYRFRRHFVGVIGFHSIFPYPGMAKPYEFRASDFTPQAKERIAHETAEARELGTS
jgi:hypothetical protein